MFSPPTVHFTYKCAEIYIHESAGGNNISINNATCFKEMFNSRLLTVIYWLKPEIAFDAICTVHLSANVWVHVKRIIIYLYPV